jgi:hypothetical protein
VSAGQKTTVSVTWSLFSVRESCDAAFNADVNGAGAENIRLDLIKSNSESSPNLNGNRSTSSADWHSPESTFTTCPADSNRRVKW